MTQQTSHLPTKTGLLLLEQKCVGDWPRSVLSIAKTTEGYEGKVTEEKLNICIKRLCTEFGESKEDKCRRLAAELSAIQQERGELLEKFAFKYKKLLHQLEKLGEKIAKDCPTFVISQFIFKVGPNIAQQLVASEFEMLSKTIKMTCHVELPFQTPSTASNASKSLDEWKVTLNAFVSSTTAVKPPLQNQHPQQQQWGCYICGETNHLLQYCPKYRKENSKQPEICRNYNLFLIQTAKKMATNASRARNISANSAINGAVKPSNIRKMEMVYQVKCVVLHLMRLIL